MKTTNITFLILGLLFTSCSSLFTTTIHGSGIPASETRTLPGFTTVDLQGAADLQITLGAQDSLRVETDHNILSFVDTWVQGGKLCVSTKSGVNFSTSLGVKVILTMKSLSRVDLTGMGNVRVLGVIQDLDVTLTGLGNITLEGVCGRFNASLTGNGTIFAQGLQAQDVNISLTGVGDTRVQVNRSLNAEITGMGSIYYSGSPLLVEKRITGLGSIIHNP